MQRAFIALATLACLSALSTTVYAADLATALTGRRLTVVREGGQSLGTVQLEPAGAAERTALNGKTFHGTWQVIGDRICVTFPPRKQACWRSAQELAANGHTTMTNRAGEKISVTAQ
jgi:hypothetical protein